MTPTSTATAALPDGRALELTVARPENSVRGGIVVLHESHGEDTVRALVSAFAAEGWLAVAPHLFHDGSHDGAGTGARPDLDAGTVFDDFDASCVYLSEHDVPNDRIGVLGFDLGAAVALAVGAKRSVGAAVSVGGAGVSAPTGLPAPADIAVDLSCPWLGLYGEGGDTGKVEHLRSAANRSEVATDLVRLPGSEHRFDAASDSSAEAWQRTLNWFDSHLR